MKKTIAIVTITSALLMSCGGDNREKVAELKPVAVKVAGTGATEEGTYVSASGKIEAENSANVSTRMMGYVTKLNVKVGQKIRKGQLLVSVNNTDLQAKKAQVEASIIQAQAAYNNAKKDYDRFVNLFAQQSASQKELDDMTARYEMAKAGLEAAKQMRNEVNAQFAYANIAAPFDGVVTNTFVKEGDMANPGMPLVSVEGAKKLQVTAMVSESDIASVKEGMKVNVLVKSVGQQLTGKVSEVSLSAKNTGGQYLVKIDLEKTEVKILSGMFVNVQFPIEKRATQTEVSDVVLIPQSALIKQGQLTGIYTVGSDNVAVLRWLRLGKTFGDQVEVLSGLNSKEQYIVSAEGKLFNGAKISIQ
ncbi:efflux RND transporter periplasmic adaptor subunit [Flavobacterium sp. U410]